MATAKENYNAIENAFAEELKTGDNPFASLAAHNPVNGATQREIKGGFNRLHLKYKMGKNGWKCPKFATMKQINKLGGKVLRGEKSTPVIFWSLLHVFVVGGQEIKVSGHSIDDAVKEAQKKNPAAKKSDHKDKIFFMKHFNVFNFEQTDIPLDMEEEIVPETFNAETLVSSIDATIVDGSGLPVYDYDADLIECPTIDSANADELYPMLFEEMVHWTSPKDRLDRELDYAEETLVGLIGSTYLSMACGFDAPKLEEDVVEALLKKLQETPYFLWKAASYAEEAYKHLVGFVGKEEAKAA